MTPTKQPLSLLASLWLCGCLLAACRPQPAPTQTAAATADASIAQVSTAQVAILTPELTATPPPARPLYDPGTLVDYTAQTGDNLIALAARFNTTVREIRAANPIIPDTATTMPAGFPMKIPVYYRTYWGSQFQILPDSLYVNGPAQLDFDTHAFVAAQPGWLKNYREYAAGQHRDGAGLVDLVAQNFSVSPRLLLALLEYQAGALSQPVLDDAIGPYMLGYEHQFHRGVYLQLVWAANTLNNAYYQWRNGKLIEFDRPDGTIYRPDPWQNAASVSLQEFFNTTLPQADFATAIGPQGFIQTYTDLFGDPWAADEPHIPGSLLQPELRLPSPPGELWSYTGGPHTGWGTGNPWAALDFAPGSETRGCVSTTSWALAMADGLVVRSEPGTVVLDLDGDGDERTGWVLFYLHLATNGRAAAGQQVQAGWPLGHPSCEGGSATGTHVHIARKYNGEWIEAAGALPFVMEGWTAGEGSGGSYTGTLTRLGQVVRACTCSDAASSIVSRAAIVPFPTLQMLPSETAAPNP
ncbi:MAG: LysM peptidoglycan-binding domain-containing protein [Anaerolineales bacterium]|nr:LysM peptidoglycan-binding domain-containing protein [Anaerolineales bacterium]MCW5887375.1 LysM peptidoglycan-binding domain-containing protein [Anaerolineales bacterium]